MVIWAWGFGSMSRQANDIAAVSMTAPAAVIHELLGRGERKKGNEGCEVWLSSTSTNHCSHSSQPSARCPRPRMRNTRVRNVSASGGLPARTSSFTTSASRREKLL